jgi:hypothetical protein
LRDLGRYQESLDTARKVVEGFAAIGGRENLDWLNARKSFAAAPEGYYTRCPAEGGGSTALPPLPNVRTNRAARCS